ncbi:hypothetical protein [Neobacillus sp. YIM B06451]|uniref:hypothetical protein n=1 Tax=Neobacillus sp. YIM B06451 TaxID=3070994 RepID=UPI00293128D8|nr:hypothetical protein [Neobacillus sp. YIM B06451]
MEEKTYTAADLSEQLVHEIKSFEKSLSGQANKNLVVIAYEKEEPTKGGTY